ncbi:type II toxin-antitoxin system Phd/YefM family antitoxin [Leifsonia sp. TF02-11]|uniref:type II toxin-antitoxin system Phd/YefM family antitoxin n=1 Tax=Leifsonia sp. TF02-11 TaxID=2815212 RepID=UPI001AA11E65|nr:type II toxin-antitoxin system Phd/YefM family antitoxin [Leifsonia sp. TF02-11]MBO1737370.1 type II toxin-antitoxin system Phd/YefM family antitoxin [Leifsonia sp. TF02-11]
MQTLPISQVKSHLNELVDAAATTHEQVTITKNGVPAAMIVGIDEWEALQETLYWLSQQGTLEAVSEARSELATGRGLSESEVRARFGTQRTA